jgi:XTP/dITP diphosphohydrolase
MTKLKYSSLVFVSNSEQKYDEYCKILGIGDLKLSKIPVVEPQNLDVHLVVKEKINLIMNQIPPGVPFFVEHTGLMIDAWKGLPGGLTKSFMDTVGNDGICRMLKTYEGEERTARAKVVIGYYHPIHYSRTFSGEVMGKIASEPHGKNGFGWDAIFIPDGETKTYGEMNLEEKNRTSMRKSATDQFQKFLKQNFEL